jgi:hypothetical protein
MLSRNGKTITASLIAALLICTGSIAMSNQAIELHWEWLAGRPMETKVLVKVDSIAKVSKGLFGMGASPSVASALPDPKDLEVSVISGPGQLVGQRLRLRLPGVEAGKLTVGAHAALGLITNNTVCSCVAAVPTTNPQEEVAWLAQWSCAQQ